MNTGLQTKSTRIGPDKYGCRVYYNDELKVECVVEDRMQIGPAFRSMIRTLDKCGGSYDTSRIRKNMYREGVTNKPFKMKFHGFI